MCRHSRAAHALRARLPDLISGASFSKPCVCVVLRAKIVSPPATTRLSAIDYRDLSRLFDFSS